MLPKSSFSHLKVLIVEDHPSFIKILGLLLKELDIIQVESVQNYKDGIKIFRTYHPDLVFMDIDLGNNFKTGIDLAEKYRKKDHNLAIIFLTANYTREYYDQVRHLKPSSFMDKNLSLFKMYQAIDFAVRFRDEKNQRGSSVTKEPPVLSKQQYYFQVNGMFQPMSLDDINYFISCEGVTIIKQDAEEIVIDDTIRVLEKNLFPYFLRSAQSCLVNRSNIEKISFDENT